MQCYAEQADHVYLDVADVALEADVLAIHRVMDWGTVENGTACGDVWSYVSHTF